MCGIVGLLRHDGRPADPDLIARMAALLTHRGPDETATWAAGPIAFGHTRLSIIDVAGSHQPMSALGGDLHLCFNGEIFNYQQLRAGLAARGFPFQTQGDAEVLLAQYAEHGPEGATGFDGQFAFAIHDGRDGSLHLVRDRLGILPLYYYSDARVFVFASEIKALLPALPAAPQVDADSVREYLAFRSVPAPHTMFQGIRKLEPGHRIRIRPGEAPEDKVWWRLPTAPADESMPADAAVRSVAQALEDAVRSRLVSDVPVGAYLSGGLDSSLIVALMRKIRGDAPIETYSAGFGDPRYDELPYALEVSRALGTVHHPVEIRAEDFAGLWPRLTWHRDAPLSEPADIAVYQLAAAARGTVKVLLSGEGSDEIFAGYPKYRFARIAALAGWLPAALRPRLFRALADRLPPRMARHRIMLRAMGAGSEAERFQTWFAPFVRDERQLLLPGHERDGPTRIWARAAGDLVQRMLYVDCHTWLVDNLLERGDRMSMAASIENRPPFLDHHLVELAFRIPSRFKVRSGKTKWIVKEVARQYLPAHIVDRRKVGFRVPLDTWFKGSLGGMARESLLAGDSFVGSTMCRREVEALLDRHDQGRRNEDIRIWTLLGLEIWHRAFFKNSDVAAAGRTQRAV